MQSDAAQRVSPHDLTWDDPNFGKLHLRIERNGGELELQIRADTDSTQHLLQQSRHAIADELQLRRDALHIADESRDARDRDFTNPREDGSKEQRSDTQNNGNTSRQRSGGTSRNGAKTLHRSNGLAPTPSPLTSGTERTSGTVGTLTSRVDLLA